MKEFWSSLASLMGVFAFCQTMIPPELRFLSAKLFTRLFNYCSSYHYYDITEIDGVNTNELYNAAQLYLSAAAAHSSIGTTRLTLTRALNSSAVTFGLSNNDRLIDTFNGVPVLWEHVVTHRNSQNFSWRPLPDEKRGFSLRIRKRETILELYLDHIMEKAYEIKRRNQDRFLYTNSRGGGCGSLDSRSHPWESVPFKHPSTFETLAMDPLKKDEIMADLTSFATGQSFYQKTGRAWKRGYLLYGPPGTGKSSMIAAMANFLGYDIYDLELTQVQNNSELRKLLMKTSSRSIIVIEDIDCSINLTNRNKINDGSSELRGPPPPVTAAGDEGPNSITLSGLLNFTDGLWSCCGSEKIFVFTTNHVEKLDPALLRSGRMDMHVFMSYCSFSSLKILLKNYLGFDNNGDLDENVMKELEEVIEEAEITPADVSEVLIKNRCDREKAVEELIETLKMKAARNGEKKRRKICEEEEEEQEKRALDSPKVGTGFEQLHAEIIYKNGEQNELKNEEKDANVEG